MATQLLQIGVVTTLSSVAPTIYALPYRECTIFTNGATTIHQSTDPAMASTVAVTLSGGQAKVAGAFIKVTTTADVILKKV